MRGARRNLGGVTSGRRVRQLPHRLAVVALAALLCVVGVRCVAGQGNVSSEYQVKAAFLFHFAQFVDWPPEAFKEPGSPLTYCTAGGDPFHGALDASLNGKAVDGRWVRVLHFRQAQEIQGCQVLFLGTPEKKFISATLANLKGDPVLTVGESEHFVQEGGMIGFVLEDNKVRFEINQEATEHAKLKISARLLALAKTVIGGPKRT
jgi:hypothetical protein